MTDMRSIGLVIWQWVTLALVAALFVGCSTSSTDGSSAANGTSGSGTTPGGGNATAGNGGTPGCSGASCGGATATPGGGTGPGNPAGQGGASNPTSGAGGQPTVSCNTGMTACGNQCVDVRTDTANCGRCGNACQNGACSAGACPKTKMCFAPVTLASPALADFESYNGTDSIDMWGFSLPATPGVVYAGPYKWDDATGTPSIAMTTGRESKYALSTSNPQATAYGGGLGIWMSCIDASAYAGISLWVRGETPTDTAYMTLAMEETSAPAETDPAEGGTCVAVAEADCEAPHVDIPVTATWTQLLIPWASFTPGVAANGSEVPVDGHNLAGLGFGISLAYVAENPDDPDTEYVPTPGAYSFEIDDIAFIQADACPAGQSLCGVGCVNYQTDAANCGSCGNACDLTRTCVAGKCECPAGYTDCNGECANLQIDSQHCGMCGSKCTGPCVGGTCQASTCMPGATRQNENCSDGSSITLGKYWVNNNQWGADAASGQVCIWSTCESGNTIGWGTSWNWTGGDAAQVKSYGSVVLGWQWGWKVTNTGLPVQLSSNRKVTCGWTFTATSTGNFNVAYDLFAHPSADPGTSSDPTDEIMIWLYRNNASPIGAQQASASVAGTDWNLHRGSNGRWNVMSYVRASNTQSATFDTMLFMKDLVNRGWIAGSKYLVSVQAGSEAFTGQGSIDTSSYYCLVE
jgi:hypothetical protein